MTHTELNRSLFTYGQQLHAQRLEKLTNLGENLQFANKWYYGKFHNYNRIFANIIITYYC